MTTSTSALPALPVGADTRSITERFNAMIRNLYNKLLPVGAANTVLTSDGTTFSWAAPPTATDTRLLQVVTTETGAVVTGTTIIPFDDTIPQNTEGDQYMSLAITPKSATSRLVIDVVWNGTSSSANTSIAAALFQDATANALAATWTPALQTFAIQLILRHVMVSGTTSATTFKVRVGAAAAGTTTFNGSGAARIFGGVMASSIVIREVLP